MTREYTRKLLDALDEGLLTDADVVNMCLSYMSEDDVKDMCNDNDLFNAEDEDQE